MIKIFKNGFFNGNLTFNGYREWVSVPGSVVKQKIAEILLQQDSESQIMLFV